MYIHICIYVYMRIYIYIYIYIYTHIRVCVCVCVCVCGGGGCVRVAARAHLCTCAWNCACVCARTRVVITYGNSTQLRRAVARGPAGQQRDQLIPTVGVPKADALVLLFVCLFVCLLVLFGTLLQRHLMWRCRWEPWGKGCKERNKRRGKADALVAWVERGGVEKRGV